jgi:GNAT superfamily N-acetyltransferase
MEQIDIMTCDYSEPACVEALSRLINEYIDDEMGGGIPLSPVERQRMIEGLKTHPKSIVLFARRADVFIGLLTAFENFSTFTARPMINIHDLIVSKEYRGLGAGRKLMMAIIAEAERRNCSRLTLEVRKDNFTAQALYDSLGFAEAEQGMYYRRKPIKIVEQ